jgi:hypothetical protein
MNSKTPLTSPALCRFAGITYRQLDYWIRCGWVETENERRTGSGYARTFTRAEAERVALMAELANAGIAPGAAHLMTFRGRQFGNRFRAQLYGNVYVEVVT